MTAKGVIDLAFCDIQAEADIINSLAEKVKEEEQMNGPMSPTKTKRRYTELRAVRMGNNNISNVDILAGGLVQAGDRESISWLDLSFNAIEKLTPAFAEAFPNLQLLYLQANQITKLTDLKVLSHFKNLKSLVLFGNPVEGSKHYRNMILWACPHLEILDFCPITKQQRAGNVVWADVFRRKLYPDEYY